MYFWGNLHQVTVQLHWGSNSCSAILLSEAVPQRVRDPPITTRVDTHHLTARFCTSPFLSSRSLRSIFTTLRSLSSSSWMESFCSSDIRSLVAMNLGREDGGGLLSSSWAPVIWAVPQSSPEADLDTKGQGQSRAIDYLGCGHSWATKRQRVCETPTGPRWQTQTHSIPAKGLGPPKHMAPASAIYATVNLGKLLHLSEPYLTCLKSGDENGTCLVGLYGR